SPGVIRCLAERRRSAQNGASLVRGAKLSDPSLARRTAAVMSRRRFLRVSAIATGAVPTAAALLEACTRSPEPAKPRPSHVVVGSGHATAPTTLPISEAN